MGKGHVSELGVGTHTCDMARPCLLLLRTRWLTWEAMGVCSFFLQRVPSIFFLFTERQTPEEFLLFFFLCGLAMGAGAWCVRGKHSTIELHPRFPP